MHEKATLGLEGVQILGDFHQLLIKNYGGKDWKPDKLHVVYE